MVVSKHSEVGKIDRGLWFKKICKVVLLNITLSFFNTVSLTY